MLQRINKIITSFFGALGMAVFGFVSMGIDIAAGATIWAWVMGACTLFWLNMARLALKNKGTHESNVRLTDDQEQRIEIATREFHAVVKEVELELKRAVREQANVQSNQRKDQEAGKETTATDGRTDSKEDRTPR
jgi:hypothetical protein